MYHLRTFWFGLAILAIPPIALALYLVRLNRLLKATPSEVRRVAGEPWTPARLRNKIRIIDEFPIDYSDRIPPKLDRRYIVTGGSGLVGGHIVLQLLERGTPPKHIRIVDIRKPERKDMLTGLPTEVDFAQTDIASTASVEAAFSKPWHPSAVSLPLTVFHTAAVIIPSDRSPHLYGFPESVNVHGTNNVLAAARKSGADIFSSTSSASIAIRPVGLFPNPWAKEPRNFWQVLDERDFFNPLRPYDEFYGTYPVSKAVAERLVCAEDCETFRTGCIRPANGVYGDPSDNPVGALLSKDVVQTWIPHIVQNFVHGANVAIAHLCHEAVLQHSCPQSGRPFVVTDPNPPITYKDIYVAIKALSVHPIRIYLVPPALVLVLAHVIEWYNLLPYRYERLRGILPEIKADAKHCQPGLFSICTHLVATDAEARKPVNEGGLGYQGVLTTLEGIVLEILEWNREHRRSRGPRKPYTTSVSLAEKIQQLGNMSKTVKI